MAWEPSSLFTFGRSQVVTWHSILFIGLHLRFFVHMRIIMSNDGIGSLMKLVKFVFICLVSPLRGEVSK